MNKSILETVHDSAKDLHKAGTLSETTLREFDALCLPPVKEFTAVQIKRIRVKNKASQAKIIPLSGLIEKPLSK